jgi:uncharacterized protein YndB with AHSA1/START domain
MCYDSGVGVSTLMARARVERRIEIPVFIHASPKNVFRWLSEPELLTKWFMDRATISPRKGGRYSFAWDGGPVHSGDVVEYVSGKHLTLNWQWPGSEKLDWTKLKLSVRRKAGGSVVKFTHTGFGEGGKWVDLYEGAIRGWTYFLMNLKSVIEVGHDLRSPYDW